MQLLSLRALLLLQNLFVSTYSASWSYVEDVEEFSEKKDELLLNNKLTSVMISDASAAAAALAACSDAQRGIDNMAR